jgi:hypothetical protein
MRLPGLDPLSAVIALVSLSHGLIQVPADAFPGFAARDRQ